MSLDKNCKQILFKTLFDNWVNLYLEIYTMWKYTSQKLYYANYYKVFIS